MDDFEVISYIGGDNVEEEVGDVSFMQETYHSHYDILKNYDIIKKNNITRAKLTKYERTKCLGMRAEMLASGAEPLIQVPPYVTSVEQIARLELEQKKLPFILRRKNTDSYDYWKISDLEV
jgi:DNA-directed RNA polymerase subunit K/omega